MAIAMPPIAWPVGAPGSVCQGKPWLFALPLAQKAPQVASSPSPCPKEPLSPLAEVPPPLSQGAKFPVLFSDGQSKLGELSGVYQGASLVYLEIQPTPNAPVPLGLLLRTDQAQPQERLDPASLSGVVRRRIGRKSLASKGSFVGQGASIAAVFKLRSETVQVAVFGEDGGLRLHQPVKWRKGRALPAALLLIKNLAGPAKDGLLLVGEGEGGATYLLLEFAGKSLLAHGMY